jgi:2-alkyl-3-oxoalkanoate reductase
MRVLVAGATGVIGQPLVSLLQACGHEVTGLTRSQERAEALRSRGAAAMVCDVFDTERLRAIVAEAQPEAVVDQLTDLPPVFDPRRYEQMTVPTNRLRSEGTPSLVAAAEAAGAQRYLAQSLAFVYAPEGEWVKDEDAPLVSDAPAAVQRTVDAVRTLESAVLDAAGLEGIVLRYGNFYGPGASESLVDMVRKRKMPVVGGGQGVWSWLHLDDAASATVAAVERGQRGVYNIVDDDPAPVSEWLPYLAEVVGAKPPMRVPAWLGRLAAGEMVVGWMTEARGASNEKARRELDWKPAWASWRDGFRHGLTDSAGVPRNAPAA